MALTDKREEAERLYVWQGMSCPAIADQLGIDPGTVYRWKKESAGKGDAPDWDSKRRICVMSPNELLAVFTESVKNVIIEIKADPKLLLNSKTADSLVKLISALQKIDPRSQYLGVAIDLIKVINAWLADNDPELKTKMEAHWDQIYEALNSELTRKGIF